MRHQNVAWVLVAALMFVCCSGIQQTGADSGKAEGIIYSIGNEPFTRLGLQTSDGTMYVLKCPKEIEQALNQKQGQKIKVYFENKTQSPEGLILQVSKFEENK